MRLQLSTITLLLPTLLGMAQQVDTYGPVEFTLKNEIKGNPGLPLVSSAGKIALQLTVSDTGDKVKRKLRTFVAVYERPDPKSLKVGKLVKQYLDPKVLSAEEAGEVTSEVDLQFPAEKGDYIVYVFLCNPDQRVTRTRAMRSFADTLEFPGDPRRMKSLVAHVD